MNHYVTYGARILVARNDGWKSKQNTNTQIHRYTHVILIDTPLGEDLMQYDTLDAELCTELHLTCNIDRHTSGETRWVTTCGHRLKGIIIPYSISVGRTYFPK